MADHCSFDRVHNLGGDLWERGCQFIGRDDVVHYRFQQKASDCTLDIIAGFCNYRFIHFIPLQLREPFPALYRFWVFAYLVFRKDRRVRRKDTDHPHPAFWNTCVSLCRDCRRDCRPDRVDIEKETNPFGRPYCVRVDGVLFSLFTLEKK